MKCDILGLEFFTDFGNAVYIQCSLKWTFSYDY